MCRVFLLMNAGHSVAAVVSALPESFVNDTPKQATRGAGHLFSASHLRAWDGPSLSSGRPVRQMLEMGGCYYAHRYEHAPKE